MINIFMALMSLFPRVGRSIIVFDISVPLLFFEVNISSLTRCVQAQRPGDAGDDLRLSRRTRPGCIYPLHHPSSMTDSPLMGNQTLFRDRDLFEIEHLPETFNYRDAQVEDLAFALRPAFDGATPLNTVLRGLPGTGKTTAVRRLFAEIMETTGRVAPVLVSCQTDRTAYAVYSQVYLALFGHPPPDSGISNRRILAGIARQLLERRAVLVVCLDDAGYLLPDGVLNRVLAGILRMHEAWPGTRTGVLLTVPDPDLALSLALDPATLSVLRASEVYFPPYNLEEVRGILSDRVRAGLYPGVVSPSVLDLLAERAHACGDLRVGLDMIRRAALAAEQEARKEVTDADVLEAYEVSRHLQVALNIRSLSAGEKKVLDAVVAADREGPATSGMVYGRVCEEERVCYTAFYERMQKLEYLRLVDLEVWHGQGRSRVVMPRDGVEEVVDAKVGRRYGR